MDSFLMFYPIDENIFRVDLLTIFPQYCVLGVLLCLFISYSVYSKVLWRSLAKSKIPKLYKITTLHSLWMGLFHLMISNLCFYQLGIISRTLVSSKVSQPDFLNDILHAATVNICQYSIDCNDNYTKSACPVKPVEWTPFNSIFLIIICAVHIHEIFLAIRNKMNFMFYSQLLGLIFVVTAAKTSCPALCIQGSYLMSINLSSKEIARALVAWKSYSQEDSDHRPSPIMKAVAFLVFLYHMLIWSSLMVYFMPFFIHKMPSIDKNDANRMFSAYAYLSFLAYILLEAGTSPLWKLIRCLGWCRRSSGLTWRIFALADCHFLGHYGPLVKELSNIQLVLDKRKSKLRTTMMQKHLASLEGRKRKTSLDPQTPRRASLLATVSTLAALKRKMQRRADDIAIAARSVTFEDLPRVLLTPAEVKPQVLVTPADSRLPQVLLTPADSTDLLDNELESSSGSPGEVEEKSTAEKDEVTSIENALDAAQGEEGEKSETIDEEDRTEVIED